MYRTVYELTDEEMSELKEAYYWQLVETGEGDILDDGIIADDIPDEMILEHYDDILFVEEDFYCNIEDGNYEGCGAVYADI